MFYIQDALRAVFFCGYLLSLGLFLGPATSGQKMPPKQPEKGCECESRFKACKRFAKNKEARKTCEEDRRKCKESCL